MSLIPGSEGTNHRAAEFFAGIGLVGSALKSEGVSVVWANDISDVKARLFVANHDPSVFRLGDIRDVTGDGMPDIDLATASFPCTDLSLAGNRAGLKGEQSGMFWEFARVLEEMGDRRPRAILLENVVGFFSSHGGEDLRAAFERLNGLGYWCDLVFVDARWFLPQSRPRVFIVGSLEPIRAEFISPEDHALVRPGWFRDFATRHDGLRIQTFDLPVPAKRVKTLYEYVERPAPDDGRWWDATRTQAFVDSLSPINSNRLDRLIGSNTLTWRTAYRRTRGGVPVWEIREDAISGCLRTARGGSSKQAVVEAGMGEMRVRWMTAREYARLQGAPRFDIDSVTESQAMFGFGDAVCVPAVRFIVRDYLLPLLDGSITEGAPTVGQEGTIHTAA